MIQMFVNAVEDLPDIWKTLGLIVTILTSGIAIGLATSFYVSIPDRLDQVEQSIVENRDSLVSMRLDFDSFLLRFDYWLCVQNPKIDADDCIQFRTGRD